LTHLTPKEIAPLIQPSAWTKRFRALVDDSPPSLLGYALNLGVDREVIPEGMAGTTFFSSGPEMENALFRVERIPQKDKDKGALNVSRIVPLEREYAIASGALRDSILDAMRALIPFLDNHLKVIHSPFDNFGPLDLAGSGTGVAPPVPHLEEVPRWRLRPPPREGVLGVGNLPHRAGLKGLLMSGDQVVSGLGTEGELIAAWGAARIAGKMDPRRERLVRSMRAKVEM
jgi:hypothetical protein